MEHGRVGQTRSLESVVDGMQRGQIVEAGATGYCDLIRFGIDFGLSTVGTTVLRNGFVSMSIGWQQPIINFVGDDGAHECHLWAAEYSGLLALQGENRWYVEQPKKLKNHKFKVEVAQDRGLTWKVEGKKEYVSPSDLADHIVRLFLDLISRANQGKISRPRI